ncbi:hypothetical protein Chor_004554, partial [Crotalus horridus]
WEPSTTMICLDGEWNQRVSCEPIDCRIPDQHHVYPATFNCSEGTTLGKRSSPCRNKHEITHAGLWWTCRVSQTGESREAGTGKEHSEDSKNTSSAQKQTER